MRDHGMPYVYATPNKTGGVTWTFKRNGVVVPLPGNNSEPRPSAQYHAALIRSGFSALAALKVMQLVPYTLAGAIHTWRVAGKPFLTSRTLGACDAAQSMASAYGWIDIRKLTPAVVTLMQGIGGSSRTRLHVLRAVVSHAVQTGSIPDGLVRHLTTTETPQSFAASMRLERKQSWEQYLANFDTAFQTRSQTSSLPVVVGQAESPP